MRPGGLGLPPPVPPGALAMQSVDAGAQGRNAAEADHGARVVPKQNGRATLGCHLGKPSFTRCVFVQRVYWQQREALFRMAI